MNRAQGLIIGIIIGLVILVFVGLAVLLLFPYERVVAPPPTSTSSPAATVTPTFPNFMPTPSFITPVPPEPTATNTRLPTTTPAPTGTPTPTVVLSLPTPAIKPTATPLPATPVTPIDTPTLIPPTPVRQYSVSFEADETTIDKGECTELKWQTQGPVTVWLGEQPVDSSGQREVCPERDTSYTLIVQVEGSNQLDRKTVKISVKR